MRVSYAIVFVSDRFSSELDVLRIGAYELAILDLATRRTTHLPAFEGARHGSPQWGRDGMISQFSCDGERFFEIGAGMIGGDICPIKVSLCIQCLGALCGSFRSLRQQERPGQLSLPITTDRAAVVPEVIQSR